MIQLFMVALRPPLVRTMALTSTSTAALAKSTWSISPLQSGAAWRAPQPLCKRKAAQIATDLPRAAQIWLTINKQALQAGRRNLGVYTFRAQFAARQPVLYLQRRPSTKPFMGQGKFFGRADPIGRFLAAEARPIPHKDHSAFARSARCFGVTLFF